MKKRKPYHDPEPYFRKLMKNPKYRILVEKQREQFRLATVIRKARDRAGLTQKELAARVGTKQSAISRVESGIYKHVPSIMFLQKVAYACGAHLGISFEYKKAS